MTGVFYDNFIDKPAHPWAKPVTLMEKLVLIYTNPGDLVFDPFCGSGTTGIACKKHGRRFIGCETNEEYFQLAKSAYGP
jgi:site-specific DNA-methyltransferase (adenine-specific)